MSLNIETNRCRPNPDRHLKGQKRPLKPKEVWAVRIRLEMAAEPRDCLTPIAASAWSPCTAVRSRSRIAPAAVPWPGPRAAAQRS